MTLRNGTVEDDDAGRADAPLADPQMEAVQDSASPQTGDATPAAAPAGSPIYKESSSPEQGSDETGGTVETDPLAIPDLGTVDSNAEVRAWSLATIAHAVHFQSLEGRTDDALRMALAMVYLAESIIASGQFKTQLKKGGAGIPGSSNPYAFPVAVYFRLDVKHVDTERKRRDSKRLNEYASALAQLKMVIAGKWAEQDIVHNADCAGKIAALIKEEGGVNALARAYAISNRTAETADLIEIDKDELRQIIVERGRKKFISEAPDGATLVGLAVAYSKNGKLVLGPVLDDLSDEKLDEIYLEKARNEVDERVGAWAEALQIGKAIAEPKTSVLQDAGSDPNDPSTPRRDGTRQFILHPGGVLTCSSILTDASTVLRTGPARFVDFDVEGHLQLETRGRRKLEANLVDPARWPGFRLDLEEADETQGKARLVLRSDAVKEDSNGPKEADALVQYSRSAQGNYPLLADDATFKPEFRGELSAPSWGWFLNWLAETLKKKAGKEGARLKIKLSPSLAEFSRGDKKCDFDVHDGDGELTVEVDAGDLRLIADAVAPIQVKGRVRLRADRDMIAFAFETRCNSYELFVPVLQGEGVRSRRHLVKLEPKPWPKGSKS